MSSRVAFPFLVLPDDCVRFGGWLIGDAHQPLDTARDLLENWDYMRDLEVLAEVSVDMANASAALQIPAADLAVSAVLSVGTGTGRYPRRQEILSRKLLVQDDGSARLSAAIPGISLSGRLRLSIRLLLELPLTGGSFLSPVQRGSRLWGTQADVLIEDGGDSRFPIESISFSKTFAGQHHANAPWYLHWKPGALESDFSSAVRLYLNADFPTVCTRVAEGDPATLQAIMGDVISQMIATVIDDDTFSQHGDSFGDGSLGSQIRLWLDLAFPDQPLDSIRSLRESAPGRFRAAALAAAEIGGAR